MKLVITILPTALCILDFVGAQQCSGPTGPSGAHVQSGTENCSCNPDGTVTCDSFQICGVGNTKASASLSSSFTATVQCRNHGGQIVDVKTQQITSSDDVLTIQPRHGCLTIPELTTTRPTDQEFFQKATCPNRNWTKNLLGGTVSDNWVYTVSFDGFSCPFFTDSGTCSG